MTYARTYGWGLTAVTHEPGSAPTPAGHELANRIPSDVRVHRLKRVEWPLGEGWRPSWRLFLSLSQGFDRALALTEHSIQLLRESPPRVVVATGPPFETFIAGLFVSRCLGAPLVLDYRDEWTECPFGFVSPGTVDRLWERRCLAAADVVFFTTNSQLAHQVSTFGRGLGGKCSVLPNGWEEDDFPLEATAGRAQGPSEHRLRLTFLGTLGPWTNPLAFLADLEGAGARLQDGGLEIALVGPADPGVAAAVQARFAGLPISTLGLVPKSQVARTLSQADALLLFASRELERYLPGKLFDYLASGLPILIHGHPGEHSRLVESLGSGLFVPAGSHTRLRQALERLRRTPVEEWNPPARRSWLQAHTRKVLARDFFAALDGLTSGESGIASTARHKEPIEPPRNA